MYEKGTYPNKNERFQAVKSVHNIGVDEEAVHGVGAGPEEERLLAVQDLARLLDLGQLDGDVAVRQSVRRRPHTLRDHHLSVSLALGPHALGISAGLGRDSIVTIWA